MTTSPRPQTGVRPPLGMEQRAAYRIEVRGMIGANWVTWFEGTSIEQRADSITIDALVDQAALRGLLGRLWDLNLIVISVDRVEVDVLATGGTPNDSQR